MAYWINPLAVVKVINEAKYLSIPYLLLRLFFCFLGGTAYALALPPVNWSILAWVTLLPVFDYIIKTKWRLSWLGGWCWGLGWSLFSFRFLREIDPIIPYLLAPVIALWPAVWAFICTLVWRHTIYPVKIDFQGSFERTLWYANGCSYLRLLLFTTGSAALFVIIEWTRSRLFLWNELSVTQWRNTALLQTAAITGSFGITFLLAWGNAAIYCLFIRKGWRITLTAGAVAAACLIFGKYQTAELKNTPHQSELKVLLIQGDLSQRRHATGYSAREAIDIYAGLSRDGSNRYPDSDLILWPESAVPLPFYTEVDFNKIKENTPEVELYRHYQNQVKEISQNAKTPMLIGALDYITLSKSTGQWGMTNSALLIDEAGTVKLKYDKIHRVPFGEYIPFRSLFPQKLISYIDMGRDLIPGNNPNPLPVTKDCYAGVTICYEGVFSYLIRQMADRGANLLIVLSNDAWYPVSSEPEQHLANAVTRAVETGLPMVRCGNNGGSGVVTPWGEFTQCATPGNELRPELRRGRACFQITVPIDPEIKRTFFVRHGEWFIGLLALFCTIWVIWCFIQHRKYCDLVIEASKEAPL